MSELGETLRGEARDALIFTGSNLLNRLGGLLLMPLYWTKLSPEDYGVLAVIALFGAFQTVLSSMSLDLAITRFYYEWPEDVRTRNLGAIWTWNWLLTLAVTILFLTAVPVIGPVLFPEVANASWLLIGVAGNAVGNLFVIPASTIRIKRLPWLFVTYNLLGFATASGLGLFLVLVLDQGLFGLLISILVSNLVLAVIGAVAMLRFSRPCLSSPGLRQALRFSLHAMPAALMGTAASILDRLLLGLLANLHTLGLYSVAGRFVDVLGTLHNAMKMAYGPFVMKNLTAGGANGRRLVVAVTPYYLIPYFAVGLGLALFTGPLVLLIGQPEYFGVIGIVPWLAGAAIIGSASAYYGNGLVLGKRTDLLSVPSGAHLAVLTVLSVLLVGPFQISGIIASKYVSAATYLGLSVYLSQKIFPVGHRWRVLCLLATAAILFAVVGHLLTLDGSAWALACKATTWGAYIIVAWWIVSRGEAVRSEPSGPSARA